MSHVRQTEVSQLDVVVIVEEKILAFKGNTRETQVGGEKKIKN